MNTLRTNEEQYPYACNRDGTFIKNLETGKIVKVHIGTHGYKAFRNTATNKIVLVHRLVGFIWLTNPDNLPVINHIDHDKLNNDVDNLEWCTYSHNSKQAAINGRLVFNGVFGEDSNLATIPDETMHSICKDLQEGMRNVDIANKYGISKGYVKTIKAGKQRVEITSQYNMKKFERRKVPDDILHEVCKLISEGKSSPEIISSLESDKVNKILIKNIRRKTSYKDISDLYF